QIPQNSAESFDGTGIAMVELHNVVRDDNWATYRYNMLVDISAYMGTLTWEEGASSTPAITDVDTDEIIVDAQQDVAVTVADFGGDITSIILASGSFTTANLLDSGTGTSYTMDLPD